MTVWVQIPGDPPFNTGVLNRLLDLILNRGARATNPVFVREWRNGRRAALRMQCL